MAAARQYTDAEKAEAVALAMTIGSKPAAAQLGIPRRTVSSWLQKPPVGLQVMATGRDVAESFWRVVDEGTKAMLARIHDPKTKAGELATIVKTAVDSHALLTGGVTSRTASVNVNVDGADALSAEDRDQVSDWYHSLADPTLEDQIRAAPHDELVAWVLGQVRAMRPRTTDE